MNQKILEQITEAAKTEPKSTEHLLIKLMEEVGEASQAYLSTTKASGSEYKDLSLVDFRSFGCSFNCVKCRRRNP